jgi:hypothetical protein
MDKQTTPTWQQETYEGRAIWQFKISDGTYLYVGNYAGTDDYSVQVRRNHFLISSIETGLDHAKEIAEARLSLPIEEFNAIVAAELRRDMLKIEQDLLRLQPDSQLLPGYHAGYEAGIADTKRKIKAVLS